MQGSRFAPNARLKPETIQRMADAKRYHSLDRFEECIANVWHGPIPEVYAAAIIRFGKAAKVF